MRRAALIPTLAAVALLGAGCAAAPSSTPEPAAGAPAAPAEAVIGNAVISMTNTGYAPGTLTVPAGTSVTFRNDGSRNAWPASAVHPTHEELPGFDAKRPVRPGESYAFTFAQPGTWTYHDHLNPSITGQVVVTE